MEIIINNPEDGQELAAADGNQLIAEILYRRIIREPEADRYQMYLQIIDYIEELSRSQVENRKEK